MGDAVLEYIQKLLEDGSEDDSIDVLFFCGDDFAEYQMETIK